MVPHSLEKVSTAAHKALSKIATPRTVPSRPGAVATASFPARPRIAQPSRIHTLPDLLANGIRSGSQPDAPLLHHLAICLKTVTTPSM